MNREYREKKIVYFFKDLSNITSYAILHHVQNLFDINDDIDFIVECDKKKMLNFVKDFSKRNDLFLMNHYTIDKKIYRFDLLDFNGNNVEKIELDCACNSNGSDLLGIKSKSMLQKKIQVEVDGENFFKVSNFDEIEYYIKKTAYKNANITSYSDYLKSLDKTIDDDNIIRKYRFWKKYFASKTYTIKYFLNKFFLLINRLFEKPALIVSFLGPDGSGKSTIIDKINEYQLFNNQNYFHLKPIKSKRSSDNNVMVIDPHKYPPYSKIKSYIKLIYFVYQYNFGWVKNIIPLKIKSSLVIFDRYYDDLLIDNRRYRYSGSMKIAKFVRLFIPKPDIYFILTTDSKAIYERKKEVPFEELERQIKVYKSLADGRRYFNIDVNRSPEEIVKEIVTIMMEKMNERY